MLAQAGSAHNEVRRDDGRLVVFVPDGAHELFDEEPRSEMTVLPDGGERRACIRGKRDVIEAHERDVRGDFEAPFGQRPHCAHRKDVRARHDPSNSTSASMREAVAW